MKKYLFLIIWAVLSGATMMTSCSGGNGIADSIFDDEGYGDDEDSIVFYPGELGINALDSISNSLDEGYVNGGINPEEYRQGIRWLNSYGVYPDPDIDPLDVRGCNWMEHLKPMTLVKHLSIPGTHDATTYKLTITGPWAKDQTKDIKGQFECGARFFDVRCHPEKGRVHTVHGVVDCDVYLADVFQQLNTCLQQHPSEGVIVNITVSGDPDVNSKEWLEAMRNEWKKFSDVKFTFVEPSDTLSVGGLRKKVCILWDDNQPEEIKNMFSSHSGKFKTGTSDISNYDNNFFDSKMGEEKYCTRCSDGTILYHLVENIWENLISYSTGGKYSREYHFSDGLYRKVTLANDMLRLRSRYGGVFNNVWHVSFLSGVEQVGYDNNTFRIAERMNYIGKIQCEYEAYRYVQYYTPLYSSLYYYSPIGIMLMDFIGETSYFFADVYGVDAPKVIFMHNYFGGNEKLYAVYRNLR